MKKVLGSAICSARNALVTAAALVIAACGGGGDTGGGGYVPPPAPTGLSYTSPVTTNVGTAMTALNPTVTGTVTTYTISPALPAGIAIDSTTGAISGTPTAATAQATYTITAANGGGNASFALLLKVDPPVPSA